MHWSQKGASHNHAQLGLQDKGHAIKGLEVCYLVWLGSMKGMFLRIFVGLVPFCGHDGYRAQVPQHPKKHNKELYQLSF